MRTNTVLVELTDHDLQLLLDGLEVTPHELLAHKLKEAKKSLVYRQEAEQAEETRPNLYTDLRNGKSYYLEYNFRTGQYSAISHATKASKLIPVKDRKYYVRVALA